MARYSYTVTITTQLGVSSTLLNVQNLTIQLGRFSVQDPFRAATATISGRNLTGFLNPTIGQQVVITTNGYTVYDGMVADVSINYGILPSMDTWEIRCEDALASAGRALISRTWAATETAFYVAQVLASDASLSVVAGGGTPASSRVSGQTVTNANLLELLQTLAQTEQARIYGYGYNQIRWIGRKNINTTITYASFTDGTLTSGFGLAKFDGVQFQSLADNYATKVIVQPAGLAPQTSGSGVRSYTLDSYDVDTTQALSLSSYVLNTLVVSSGVPSSITCLAEEQSNDNALLPLQVSQQGSQIEVILRGARYKCVIEGSVISASPESSRFTYYLSSSDAYQFLVLNDTTYGVLNKGKLGF